jgi:hypothetical protein
MNSHLSMHAAGNFLVPGQSSKNGLTQEFTPVIMLPFIEGE